MFKMFFVHAEFVNTESDRNTYAYIYLYKCTELADREYQYIDSKFCFGAISHDLTFKLTRKTFLKEK